MFGPVEQSKKFPLYYKMPTGPGHYFGRQLVRRLYGQKFLIAFLMELSKHWFGRNATHPFGIGDIAEEDGKPLNDHKSHNTGAAVDIFVIHKNGVKRNDKSNIVKFDDSNVYDRSKTTDLAKMIAIKAQQFKLIQFLYNDPIVRQTVRCQPPIQWHINHDEHIHLLFNGQHSYTEAELDRILGIKSISERLREFLQKLITDVQLLMYGSRGPIVEALQIILNNQGASQFPSLIEDGVFGAKTKHRVQEFQQHNNLVADGIVGPNTKKALANTEYLN